MIAIEDLRPRLQLESLPAILTTDFVPLAIDHRYFVNRSGQVISNTSGIPRFLKPEIRTKGYLRFVIEQPKNGDGGKARILVHRAVLETFVCPRPDDLIACHNDGDPANNHVDNLRWDTVASNNHDLVIHGKSTKGERNPMAKLAQDNIPKIRALLKQGISCGVVGQSFGVSASAVWAIKTGRTWGHVA